MRSITIKSLIASLLSYICIVCVLVLIKVKFTSTHNVQKPLNLEYIGEYSIKNNEIFNTSNNKIIKEGTIQKTTPNNIQKNIVNQKANTISNNSTSINDEQSLLAKEFEKNLPTTNTPDESTIPVINEKALYKNNLTSQLSNNNSSIKAKNDSSNLSSIDNTLGSHISSNNFHLEGRTLLKAPEINDKSSQTGIVAVSITVDNDGNVIDAKAGVEGTTIPSLELWKKCEESSLQAKYSSIKSFYPYQTGIIRFRFITY